MQKRTKILSGVVAAVVILAVAVFSNGSLFKGALRGRVVPLGALRVEAVQGPVEPQTIHATAGTNAFPFAYIKFSATGEDFVLKKLSFVPINDEAGTTPDSFDAYNFLGAIGLYDETGKLLQRLPALNSGLAGEKVARFSGNNLVTIRNGKPQILVLKADINEMRTGVTPPSLGINFALIINEEDSKTDFEAMGFKSGKILKEITNNNNNRGDLPSSLDFALNGVFGVNGGVGDGDRVFIKGRYQKYLSRPSSLTVSRSLTHGIPMAITQSTQDVGYFNLTAVGIAPISVTSVKVKCSGGGSSNVELDDNAISIAVSYDVLAGPTSSMSVYGATAEDSTPCDSGSGRVINFTTGPVTINGGSTVVVRIRADTYADPGQWSRGESIRYSLNGIDGPTLTY